MQLVKVNQNHRHFLQYDKVIYRPTFMTRSNTGSRPQASRASMSLGSKSRAHTRNNDNTAPTEERKEGRKRGREEGRQEGREVGRKGCRKVKEGRNEGR